MPFVRVARVLDPSRTRTCVALVLAAAARPAVAPTPRTRRPHIGTHARPRPEDRLPPLPACDPVTPAARPGMTHRDEQSMRRRIKSTHIADYALPVDGEFAAAERHRTASSGAVCPALSFSMADPASARPGPPR